MANYWYCSCSIVPDTPQNHTCGCLSRKPPSYAGHGYPWGGSIKGIWPGFEKFGLLHVCLMWVLLCVGFFFSEVAMKVTDSAADTLVNLSPLLIKMCLKKSGKKTDTIFIYQPKIILN